MNFKTISLFMVFLLFAGCSHKTSIPASAPKEIYTAEELSADFTAFRSSLEEAHPALYRYHSKAVMDSLFDAVNLSINKQMSAREFMLVLSKLIAFIGDGHLKVSLPKQEKNKLDLGPTAIPFKLYWSNRKFYINKNYSEIPDSELLGAEIISINGHSMTDFLHDYLLIAASDGSNTTHKFRMLQRSRLLTRYYNYLYGYSENFEIEYIPANESAKKKASCKGLMFDELLKIRDKRYPADANPLPAEFSVLANMNTGYMKIRSFDKSNFKKTKTDYKTFLKSSFKKLHDEHIGNLILDLRDNGGGTDEYGRMLYAYFTSHDFMYYKSLTMNKETYTSFKYTSRPGMKAPEGMLKANSSGSFDNVKHPNYGIQKPTAPTYEGRIFVLIDGGCFSTTSEFLSMLHNHTKAVFIGEESGGGYYGNCSGPAPEFTLPNTGVSIEIPLMNYSMAVSGYPFSDRGIIPDFEIALPVSDIITGKDPVLDFAIKQIGK